MSETYEDDPIEETIDGEEVIEQEWEQPPPEAGWKMATVEDVQIKDKNGNRLRNKNRCAMMKLILKLEPKGKLFVHYMNEGNGADETAAAVVAMGVPKGTKYTASTLKGKTVMVLTTVGEDQRGKKRLEVDVFSKECPGAMRPVGPNDVPF